MKILTTLFFAILLLPLSASIEVRGGTNFGTLIPNNDTTPRTTDNTDFGTIDVGTSKTATFQIKAVGATETVIVTEDGSAWSISSGAGVTILPPGSTKTFTVKFDPTSAGYKSANIVINSSNNFNFKVEGTALGEPEIKVSGQLTSFTGFVNINDGDGSPRPDDGTAFGAKGVNDGSVSHTFEIENTGSEKLDIDSITDDSGEFSISGAPSEVGVNQTKTFTVKFNPTSSGTKTGIVTIQNNDANEDPFTFTVNGIGEASKIELRGGSSQGTSIFNGDTSPRTLDGTDFGTVEAGGPNVTNTFEIKNNGNEDLFVTLGSETTSAFSITGAPNPAIPIAPGGTNDFNIILSTTSAGPKAGTVTILSNDPDNGVFTFDIEAEATGTPEIKVSGQLNSLTNFVNIVDNDTSPQATDGTEFGSRAVSDGSIIHIFKIENTGNAKLNIDSITEGSPHFSIASVPDFVGADGDQTFEVRFNPTSSGSKVATVTIQNDDPNEDPFTFNVQGIGLEGTAEVSGGTAFGTVISNGDTTPRTSDNTDFGTVDAGVQTKSNTFRIKNTGNANLLINNISENGGAFSITSNLPALTNIGAGASRDFTILFDPSAAGSKSATVTILASDGTYTFDIKGEAEGVVTYSVGGRLISGSPFVTIPNGATEASIANGTDFGSRDVTAGGIVRTFQISNTGSAQLTVDDITVGGLHFAISGIPGVVGVNQTKTFTATFDPTSFGIKSPTVRIFTGGDSEESYSFKVLGQGDAPKLEVFEGPDDSYEAIVNGSVDPPTSSRRHFGNVVAGVGQTRVFSIKNTGNQQMLITGIAEDGAAWSLPVAPSPGTILTAGNSLTFSINVDPISAGLKQALVTILTSDPDVPAFTFEVEATATGDSQIAVLGNGIGAGIFIPVPDGATETSTSNGTEFADTDVSNVSDISTFQIHNTGNAKLNITAITENSPHFSISGIPTDVGVNQSKDFTVTFNPTSGGRKTTIVTIVSDAPGNLESYTFEVSGIGEAPDIAVSSGINFAEDISNGDSTPSTDDGTDFGLVSITGTAVTRTFRISNAGNETLIFTGSASSDSNFTLSGVPGITNPIPAGQSNDFTVTFDAGSPGFDSSIISLLSNDPDEAPFTFTVEGFGSDDQPDIKVIGKNSVIVLSGDTTPDTNDGTNLGEVTTSGGFVASVFTIENQGTGTLNLTSITENGNRFQIFGASTDPLLPGESTDFEVRFNPTVDGEEIATVRIISDDADDGTYTFSVSGTGTNEAPPVAPEIRVGGGVALNVNINNGDTTPRRFDGTDAGSVMIGESKLRTFRIGNFGDAVLTISDVVLVGAPTAVMSFPVSINPGEFGDFTVEISPKASGDKTLTLRIESNDVDTPVHSFSLKATGVDPVNPLTVTGFLINAGNPEITFISDPTKTYQVAYSHDLSTWFRPVGFSGLPGDINAQSYILPGVGGAGNQPVFFIVEEE